MPQPNQDELDRMLGLLERMSDDLGQLAEDLKLRDGQSRPVLKVVPGEARAVVTQLTDATLAVRQARLTLAIDKGDDGA